MIELKKVQQKYTNETLYLFCPVLGSINIISCTESLYIYLSCRAWVHHVTQYVVILFFVVLVFPVLF